MNNCRGLFFLLNREGFHPLSCVSYRRTGSEARAKTKLSQRQKWQWMTLGEALRVKEDWENIECILSPEERSEISQQQNYIRRHWRTTWVTLLSMRGERKGLPKVYKILSLVHYMTWDHVSFGREDHLSSTVLCVYSISTNSFDEREKRSVNCLSFVSPSSLNPLRFVSHGNSRGRERGCLVSSQVPNFHPIFQLDWRQEWDSIPSLSLTSSWLSLIYLLISSSESIKRENRKSGNEKIERAHQGITFRTEWKLH
jgi:hypothetical protein